jgi:hypothetical protein
MYTLYTSLGHAKSSQSSLVVSWQRIYSSLTVTAAHYEIFFAQPNSYLDISFQLFCQLPTPEILSIVNSLLQLSSLLTFAELNCSLGTPELY